MESISQKGVGSRDSGVSGVSEKDRLDGDLTEAQQEAIQYAFNEIVDLSIDVLVKQGLTEKDALDIVFTVGQDLGDRGLLPEFPGETGVSNIGRWVVAAVDFDFVDFCERVIG